MARRRLALIVPHETAVRQVVETEREDFGNPGNVWHDVTDQPEVVAGWQFADGAFHPPPPPTPAPEPPQPTVGELKAKLDMIAAHLARLEESQS